MIDKRRTPPTTVLTLVAIADVDVCRTGIAEVITIECAVSIQLLCIDNADGISFLSAHSDF